MPGLKLEDHHFKRMLQERMRFGKCEISLHKRQLARWSINHTLAVVHLSSVTICTDNRLVSHTDTVKELALASSTFKLTPKQLKDIVVTGFKRSFYDGPYTEKRA